MTKKEVLKNLRNNYKETENTTNAKYIKRVIALIQKSERTDYVGVAISKSQKGNLNMGCLLERVVLDYLCLDKEDNEHEVKCFINNTTNKLVNENVKTCYILLMSENYNGLYQVQAEKIKDKTLRKKYLFNLIKQNEMKKVASLNKLATC